MFNNLLNKLQIDVSPGAGHITQAKLMGFQIAFQLHSIPGSQEMMCSGPTQNQPSGHGTCISSQGHPCQISVIYSLGRGLSQNPPCNWASQYRTHKLSAVSLVSLWCTVELLATQSGLAVNRETVSGSSWQGSTVDVSHPGLLCGSLAPFVMVWA